MPGELDRLRRLEARLADRPAATAVSRAERTEETWASAALAGATLTLAETRALVERGAVMGTRPFRDYLLVWGYGAAVDWVARQRPGRRLFEIAEVRALHVRFSAASALVERAARDAGAWRTTNPPAADGRVVAAPAFVARDVALLADRFAPGPVPGESRFLWLAALHQRFDRIRPFAFGNGRAVRLLVNLVLVRLGLPFATIRPRDARAYERARRHADEGDLVPLAVLLARAAARSAERTLPARGLVPLATLADGSLSLAALRKAAARGRLRHVYRGARVFSTPEWRDRYLRERTRPARG